MTSGKFEYNDSEHLYRLNGRLIPNVTSILDVIPSKEKMFSHKPEYAQRGQDIHKELERLDKGEKLLFDYDEEVELWKAIKTEELNDVKFSRKEIECKHFHSIYLYAGTFDRASKAEKFILDIKTGVERKTDYLQLHAYFNMLLENGMIDKNYEMILAYVNNKQTDPKKAVKRFNYDKKMFNLFLNCLTVFNMGTS